MESENQEEARQGKEEFSKIWRIRQLWWKLERLCLCYKILWRRDFQNAIDATTRTKIKSLLRPEALFNGRCKQMKIMHSLK